MCGLRAQDAAAGGVDGAFIKLRREAEIGEGRARAEQIGPCCQMGIEDGDQLIEIGFYQRHSLFAGADEMAACSHPCKDHFGEIGDVGFCAVRLHETGERLGAGTLVDLIPPAEVEHQLVAPFIAKFLDQCGEEVEFVVGVDGGRGVARLQRLDDGGICRPSPSGVATVGTMGRRANFLYSFSVAGLRAIHSWGTFL